MTEDKEFDLFWDSYPKKRNKGDAFKAWCQTKSKRPHLVRILKSLTVMKANKDWLKNEGEFIPYPATWLRAWGWEDVPEVELNQVHNGKMWWETVSGIETKAKEVNFGEWNPKIDPTWQAYVNRLRKSLEEKVVPLKVAGE